MLHRDRNPSFWEEGPSRKDWVEEGPLGLDSPSLDPKPPGPGPPSPPHLWKQEEQEQAAVVSTHLTGRVACSKAKSTSWIHIASRIPEV